MEEMYSMSNDCKADRTDEQILSDIDKLFQRFVQYIDQYTNDSKMVVLDTDDFDYDSVSQVSITVINADGTIDTRAGSIMNKLLDQINDQEYLLNNEYDLRKELILRVKEQKQFSWINTYLSEIVARLINKDESDKLMRELQIIDDQDMLDTNDDIDCKSEMTKQVCSKNLLMASIEYGNLYYDSKYSCFRDLVCFKDLQILYKFVQQLVYNETVMRSLDIAWVLDYDSGTDARMDKYEKAQDIELELLNNREAIYGFNIQELETPGDLLRKLQARQLISGLLLLKIGEYSDEQLIRKLIDDCTGEDIMGLGDSYSIISDIDQNEAMQYIKNFANKMADRMDLDYEEKHHLDDICAELAYSSRLDG